MTIKISWTYNDVPSDFGLAIYAIQQYCKSDSDSPLFKYPEFYAVLEDVCMRENCWMEVTNQYTTTVVVPDEKTLTYITLKYSQYAS